MRAIARSMGGSASEENVGLDGGGDKYQPGVPVQADRHLGDGGPQPFPRSPYCPRNPRDEEEEGGGPLGGVLAVSAE